MFSKKKRITKDIFQTILKKGNIVSSSFFLFKYTKDPSPRYAFVVSKKIVRGAVKRNSLRRSGYNILRQHNIENGNGIFFYKKEALKTTNTAIKKDIDFILRKANII